MQNEVRSGESEVRKANGQNATIAYYKLARKGQQELF